MATTMVLEVGEGADKVSFTAKTFECAPVDGAACKEIPTGVGVPVTLFDSDDLATPLDSGTITSHSGSSWIFYTDLSKDTDPVPLINGAPIDSPACEDVIYEDVFGP
jgi:hypothetical protein